MDINKPLVTIGIPTYNRASFLKRAIESALNQDYENIEIIVSDNASTDETENICRYYSDRDSRLKYFRHFENHGPVANFSYVLKNASGQFFMWLGDDDWIDLAYIGSCVQQLMRDPMITLVSGVPKYYCNGQKVREGKIFSLMHNKWWHRVLSYYWQVADNGMFYGLMRTTQIMHIKMHNTMGGDWLIIANIVTMGKARVIPEISVHRELGGATASYQQIANSLGLSRIHAVFPMISIASSAWMDILVKGEAYKTRSILGRLTVACAAFIVIMAKATRPYLGAIMRRMLNFQKKSNS